MNFQTENIKPTFIIAFILLLSQNIIAQNFNLKIITDSSETINLLKKKSFNKVFNDSLNLLSELEKIQSKLFQKGYISASFDSLAYDSSEVKAYLFIGKQYTIQEIGNQNVDMNLIRKLNLNSKKIAKNKLLPHELFELYEEIIKYYENNGYPFACINPENIIFNDGKIKLDLKIKKKQFIKINKIIIKGKSKLSDVYIKRYLSIYEGDVYNESLISEINSKLNNLSFVAQIRKPEVDFYGNKADIYLYLKEKKANKFSGIIGFVPDKENHNKLSFTGDINFLLLNNFQKGEEIYLQWDRTAKLSQKLKVGTAIPYLFKSPFGTNFKFNLDKKDTSFMTVSGNLGIDYSFKNNDKIIAYAKNSSSYILSTENIDTTLFSNVKSLAFGIAYQSQNLDYKYNPSKGYYFLLDIASGNREVNSNKNTYMELQANFDFYLPLFSKFVYKFSSSNKYLFSNTNLFQNELYKVGGFNSIRGFDEDIYFSSGISVITNEIRYLYEKKSNVYIFSDIARTQQTKDNVLYLIGFGIGTNFSTKAGVFSIAYALGKEQNNPMQISNSKIHLGYVNQF